MAAPFNRRFETGLSREKYGCFVALQNVVPSGCGWPPYSEATSEGRGLSEPFSQAGDGARTHDPQLGKLMLYQLSYARVVRAF